MSLVGDSQSQEASTSSEEIMRRVLCRGGRFDVWLEKNKRVDERHPCVTTIQPLVQDLDAMLRKFHTAREQELSQIVNHWFFGDSSQRSVIHALLLYCIAEAIGCAVAQQLHLERARNYYLNNPEVWRSILGDLLPQKFIEANAAAVARKSFHSTASLASDDLDTYLNQLVPLSRERNGRYLDSTIASLNLQLGGGFHGLTVLSGDKGIGKSSVAVATMHQSLIADGQMGAIYLQLDGTKQTLLNRLLCRYLDIEYRTLEAMLSEETLQTPLREANRGLQELLGRVAVIQRTDELIRDGLALGLIEDQMRLLKGKGCRTFMVVIDLFNRIDCPPSHSDESLKDEYRLDLIQRIGKLNKLDQPLGVPVIAVCELRKGSGSRRDMSHDEILGPSRLASDADVILMLESDGDANREAGVQNLSVNITKGRDGVIRGKVPIWFEHAKTRFHSQSPAGTGRGRTAGNPVSRPGNRTVPNTQVGADVNS